MTSVLLVFWSLLESLSEPGPLHSIKMEGNLGLVLWLCILRLWPAVPVQVPGALFTIQLPASALGKAAEGGPTLWAPAPTW